MIDTMFFLLVFFILASLNVIDMKGSRVDLPDSVNQDSQARAKVTITITKDQKVSVNQGKVIGKGGSLASELLSALTSDSASGAITVRPEDAIVVINCRIWMMSACAMRPRYCATVTRWPEPSA